MHSSDALIVGGGIIGLSIAFRLREAGLSVTVIERSRPASEASAAAGGILAAVAEARAPGPFLDLCLESLNRWPALVAAVEEASGQDVSFERCGVLEVAFDPGEADRLRTQAQLLRERRLNVELLEGAALRELEPQLTRDVVLALRAPDDAQVDNRRFCAALLSACSATGVRFVQGEATALIERSGKISGVLVDRRPLEADRVVLAAGAWSALLANGLPPRAVRPMRGQMLQLQTPHRLLRHVVFGAGGYLVPRADGRILCGSTMEDVGFERRVTAEAVQAILGRASRLVPSLAQAVFADAWCGFRPATDDALPLLGRGALDGLFVASGHFRNGVLLTAATADALAALVLGRPAPFSLEAFSPARLSR